jgi:hypothetical protein
MRKVWGHYRTKKVSVKSRLPRFKGQGITYSQAHLERTYSTELPAQEPPPSSVGMNAIFVPVIINAPVTLQSHCLSAHLIIGCQSRVSADPATMCFPCTGAPGHDIRDQRAFSRLNNPIPS